MGKIKFTQRYDGEGFTQPTKAIVHWACCDCGLVHDIVFAAGNKRKIAVAVRRNKRATANKRRSNKIKSSLSRIVKTHE